MDTLHRIVPAVLLAVGLLGSPPATPAPVTLNLNDADITTLISTVAEVTGRNFVVDPRVKGKVSVVSSTAMEKEELYQVFLSILEVHGFAAVPAGKVTKVIPDANAKQSGSPLAGSQVRGEGDEIVTQVIQVSNVSATQLVPILRPLVPQQGHLAAYAGSNVLIISDRAANIQRLLNIISRIDQESDSELEVITLENAVASEVVRILTALNRAPQRAQEVAVTELPLLVADDRTNSVLMSGERVARLQMRAIISHLDTPLASTGNTHVVYLRYAKATELADVLTNISQDIEGDTGAGKQAAPAAKRAEVGIRADESSNALVITAPADVYASLRQVIAQLDIRRAQVLVEAILAEVDSPSLAELGVQWTDPLGGGSNTTFASTRFPGTESGNFDSFSVDAPGVGFALGFFRNGDLRTLVRAIASNSNNNLIATPSLMTLDNEEAEIVVGQNVPFVTGQFTNDATTPDNPFQTIERQDVGVLLKVKPQINEGDAVMLEIAQEVSNVESGTSGAGLITSKRSINTSVLVDDGQVLVLGGLLEDSYRANAQKVPLLGDLPVVGTLFRNERVERGKSNLVVFLKPTIVRSAGDINYITSRKYNFLRAQQQSLTPPNPVLLPGGDRPLLPEFDRQSRPRSQDRPAPEDPTTPGAPSPQD